MRLRMKLVPGVLLLAAGCGEGTPDPTSTGLETDVVAAATYRREDLSPIIGLGSGAALAISDSGYIVGYLNSKPGQIGNRGFRWRAGQPGEELAPLPGTTSSTTVAVNNLGWAVGSSSGFDSTAHEYTRPTLWVPGQGPVDIGLPGEDAHVTGINDSGVVVGWYTAPPGNSLDTRPFRWTAADGFVDIHPVGSGLVYSMANAVAPDGTIVGAGGDSGSFHHAFLWRPDGSTQDLGTLGTGSEVIAINASGVVAGWSFELNGMQRAFSWTPATGMIRLTRFPSNLLITGLSNRSRVIGGAKIGVATWGAATLYRGTVNNFASNGFIGFYGVDACGVIVGGFASANRVTRITRWVPSRCDS